MNENVFIANWWSFTHPYNVLEFISFKKACITILCFVIHDINELYKHIDLLNLFYRNLATGVNV